VQVLRIDAQSRARIVGEDCAPLVPDHLLEAGEIRVAAPLRNEQQLLVEQDGAEQIRDRAGRHLVARRFDDLPSGKAETPAIPVALERDPECAESLVVSVVAAPRTSLDATGCSRAFRRRGHLRPGVLRQRRPRGAAQRGVDEDELGADRTANLQDRQLCRERSQCRSLGHGLG
jgi:hypothetical protein